MRALERPTTLALAFALMIASAWAVQHAPPAAAAAAAAGALVVVAAGRVRELLFGPPGVGALTVALLAVCVTAIVREEFLAAAVVAAAAFVATVVAAQVVPRVDAERDARAARRELAARYGRSGRSGRPGYERRPVARRYRYPPRLKRPRTWLLRAVVRAPLWLGPRVLQLIWARITAVSRAVVARARVGVLAVGVCVAVAAGVLAGLNRPVFAYAAAVAAAGLLVSFPLARVRLRLSSRVVAVAARVAVVAAALGVVAVVGVLAGQNRPVWAFLAALGATGFLVALRLGTPAGVIGVLTVAMPFYNVGYLSSIAPQVGLLTLLLGSSALVVLALRRRVPWRTMASDRRLWLIVAFGVVVVASLFLATRTDLSLELSKTYAGRAAVLPLVLYACLAALGRRRAFRVVDDVATVLLVLACAGAVLSVLQVGFSAAYPNYGDRTESLFQFIGKRAIGLAEAPGTWGAFLVIPFAFAVQRAVDTRRLVWGGGALMVAVAILLSGLRTAWIAAALIVGLAVLTAGLSWRVRAGAIVAGLVAVALVMSLGNFRSFVGGGGGEGARVGAGRLAADESARMRLQITRAELEMGARYPLTGVGLGNIGRELGLNTPPDIADIARNEGIVPGRPIEKHNTYVGLFAELGAPGAILFLSILVAAFLSLRRGLQRAVGAEATTLHALTLALIGTVILAGFTESDRQAMLWWIIGMTFGLTALMRSGSGDEPRP